MDQFIAEIAAKIGVDPVVVRKAVAMIIAFLAREGPQDLVHEMIDRLPGARQLATEAGDGSSGIMGVFNDLTNAGLGLADIQEVTRAFGAHARTQVGDKEVDEVIAAIPGLGQFV